MQAKQTDTVTVVRSIPITISYNVPDSEASDLHNSLLSDIELFKPVVPFKDLLNFLRKHITEKGPFIEHDYNKIRKQDANPQTN